MRHDEARGGWEASAESWLRSIGDEGDWLRKWVLDPVMLDLVGDARTVLDVGCGEGRFARMLQEKGAWVVGIDPVERFVVEARNRSSSTVVTRADGEALPFRDGSFEAVVSYLTLVDIPDFRAAIREMARVLQKGGKLVIGNISSFASTNAYGWVRDEMGNKLYFPVDNYLSEHSNVLEWKDIRIVNYHRPLSSYMDALLSTGLQLRSYLEPDALPGAGSEFYARAPHAMAMLWEKPA